MLLDGLYTVLSVKEMEASVVLSDENHPVFKAHFPSKPILPGFVHLEIISDVFKIEILGVKKAKFTNLVLPSQTLQYVKNGNKITVICNNKDVASFTIDSLIKHNNNSIKNHKIIKTSFN